MISLYKTKFFRFAVYASLVVFTMTLVAGCDNEEFGVVKPSEADFILMNVTGADTEVAMILANQEGEQLVVLADKTSNGQIATVTGGAYATPDGETFTFWFGNDGLPEYVVTENWMFRLYNYTNNTVDIIGIDPGGNWHHWLEVDVDTSTMGALGKMAASGPVSYSQKNLEQVLPKGAMVTESAFDYFDFVHWVTFGIEVAACVIGLATAETGVGLAIAYSACGSALITVGLDLAEYSTIEYYLDPENLPEMTSYVISSIDEDTDVLDDRSDMTEFQRRITLTWGENPRDIDSHLWTPSISGYTYHVYFASKGSENSPPYAELDVDDVTSYGPENITIKRLFPGTYYYSVYHYAGSGTITTSGANVKVLGSEAEVLYSLNVPTGSAGSNWWWNVLSINGSTGAITIINEISSSPPSGTSASSGNWDVPKNIE